MLANIDGDILPYGTFDTIKTSFGSANPNHNNDRNRITEADYNALIAKIRLANINSNTPQTFEQRSVYWNIHPAATPRKMERMVITLGWISNLFHNKAKAKPIGRVKWTSSHSSVSSDLNDSFNNSLKVAIIIIML